MSEARKTRQPAPGRNDAPPPIVKVAIVGGGCAGMAAAWELSRLPGYDITVYEKSWRLGGKGSSGRAPDGRIHEHGLHLWLGFYENAFRMIRECYTEVGRRHWGPGQLETKDRLAHASFDEAFYPEPQIGVTGKTPDGAPTVWSGYLPPEKGLPGDPLDPDSNPFTLASYLLRCVDLLKTLMLSVIAQPTENVPGTARADGRSAVDTVVDLDFSLSPSKSPEVLIQSVAGKVRDGTLIVAAALLQAITIAENVLQDFNHSPEIAGSALNLMKALAGQARKQLREFVAIDPQLRWKTEIIDIVMTIAVGLYRDRVLLDRKGLDVLNNLDYREWLKKHGATNSSLESRFITGIYDLVFAYEDGDRDKPRLAAGVALRGALRMFFSYRGSMFWRMRSGMGDAVFAPLYKVMTAPRGPEREGEHGGVHFKFMHQLKDVQFKELDGRGPFVTELTFVTTGKKYRIIEPGDAVLDHLGCWPDSDEQLLSPADGNRVEATTVLRIGEHFDVVILASGLDDCAAVLKAGNKNTILPPAWASLRRTGQTVATKSAQVWLTRDLEELGWFRGSGIISALGLSFDTWADMTQTLPSEQTWRQTAALPVSARPARSVAYFCGLLPDRDTKQKKPARTDADIQQTLDKDISALLDGMRQLWPSMADEAVSTRHVLNVHVRANYKGSDRYTLSLPGSIRDRISPLDRSVLNLTMAGDWTACGLDAGCVEAAVMSGMLAAHAVTGTTPSLKSIIGYDHP